jgi:biopolymer transport protein ExbB/TolQ
MANITPDDLSQLVHAIIGLVSAITLLITIYNHNRVNELHDKVDVQAQQIDTIVTEGAADKKSGQ